jgi:hypothetical protein
MVEHYVVIVQWLTSMETSWEDGCMCGGGVSERALVVSYDIDSDVRNGRSPKH